MGDRSGSLEWVRRGDRGVAEKFKSRNQSLKSNMGKLIDLTGKTFGRLTALGRSANGKRGEAYWKCECTCGNVAIVLGAYLRNGHTRSCGCLGSEVTSKRNLVHGGSHLPTYAIWQTMKAKCTNPNSTNWHYYGGRGITVCDRWMESFEAFLEDMGECPPSHSIERVDVNGNYEPGNCKWIPKSLQARNTRKSVYVTYQGIRKHVLEWAEELGINSCTLHWRLRQGWPIEKVMTPTVRRATKESHET